MSHAHHSIVCFRISGDDLDPSELTALLGCEPSKSHAKGSVRIGRVTGNRYVNKSGLWMLDAEDREPEDIAAQITEVLHKMTSAPAVWKQLRTRFHMDFFCGVFMATSNDGLGFPSELMNELSSRGIDLELDIYDPSDD